MDNRCRLRYWQGNTKFLCQFWLLGLWCNHSLYLAQRICPLVANAFTIVLLLGIFSASAATMWSLCKFMYADNPRKNKLAALLVAMLATLVGVFPFAKLVAIILPIMAYIGMFYVVCVVYKGLKLKFKN